MKAKLTFECGFGDREAFEAEARGYLSHVLVELADGVRYRVVFWDPVRLQQDLEQEKLHGRPFVTEPGMIVVSEVTRANMETAVERLVDEKFFERLVPI